MMAPKSSIVPSKAALRALRRLTLSTPGIFVGAVGGVCGLATLNYDTHRKVQVAEKIIDTKRAIRSVSNGRGALHLANMFEAAERGEDFTLSAGRIHRGKRKKRYSTVAPQLEDEGSYNAEVPQLGSWRQDNESRQTAETSTVVERGSALIRRVPSSAHRTRDPDHEARFPPSQTHPGDRRRISKSHTQNILIDNGEPQSLSSIQRLLEEFDPGEPGPQFSSHPLRWDSRSLATSPAARQGAKNGGPVRPEHTPSEPKTGSGAILFSTRERNDRIAQKITAATMQQHKLETHTVYGRPKVTDDQTATGLADCVQSWLRPLQRTSDHGGTQRRGQDSFQPVVSRSKQPIAHGNASESSNTRLANGEPAIKDQDARPSPILRSAVAVDPSREVTDGGRYAGTELHFPESTIPFPGTATESDFSQRKHQFIAHAGARADHTDLKDSVSDDLTRLRAFLPHGSSRQDKGPDLAASTAYASLTVPQLEGLVDAKKLEQIKKQIYDILLSPGQFEPRRRARALWVATMKAFSATNKEADWAMLELLYYEFRHYFPSHISPVPVRRLARYLLATGHESSRLRGALFPHNHQDGHLSDRDACLTVNHYLSEFCQDCPDAESQVAELGKIILVAESAGAPMSEHLIVPVIRSLCAMGDLTRAQSVVDEMATLHGVPITFYTEDLLVIGYAAAGNWAHVEDALDRLHRKGLSRSQPIQFSTLFKDVFEHYVAQHSLAQSYDFLVFAVRYWGLVPTSFISTRFIKACIKDARYDFIQEWVQAVRESFPQVDIGTSNHVAALRIGQTWKEMRASCEDVEKSCRAMAHGAIADPFSNVFRAITMEHVTLDLAERLGLQPGVAQASRHGQVSDRPPTMHIDDLRKQADEIISRSQAASDETAPDQQVQDLIRQTNAVRMLNDVFSGDIQSTDVRQTSHAEQVRGSSDAAGEDRFLSGPEGLVSSVPQSLRGSRMPPRKELMEAIAEVYYSQEKSGLPVSHAVLKHTARQLQHSQRCLEAAQLFEIVYESDYVQGPDGQPFDLDIFSSWLDIAIELRSIHRVQKALWAVVDSARHLRITTHFVLLTRIAGDKASTSLFYRRAEELYELHYLLWRLQRLRWIGAGMPEQKPKFPRFKTWGEKIREA